MKRIGNVFWAVGGFAFCAYVTLGTAHLAMYGETLFDKIGGLVIFGFMCMGLGLTIFDNKEKNYK